MKSTPITTMMSTRATLQLEGIRQPDGSGHRRAELAEYCADGTGYPRRSTWSLRGNVAR